MDVFPSFKGGAVGGEGGGGGGGKGLRAGCLLLDISRRVGR